jgi:Protein of unknown function (DUF3306)
MGSVLLLRRYAARKRSTAAFGFMKLELRREVPERRKRAVNLRCSEMLVLLAISTLAFLANGAMTQAQEVSMPIFSSGLHDATPVETQVIESLSQHPATQSLFGAANLSPIKPIGTGSDIRSFLAPGLPAELTRAALRRAWLADPAIRDFIGLSENSWDFNAPRGVPGFGSLERDDARGLLARAMKETEHLDSERLAAKQLTHDQVPVMTGEAIHEPSSVQVK